MSAILTIKLGVEFASGYNNKKVTLNSISFDVGFIVLEVFVVRIIAPCIG